MTDRIPTLDRSAPRVDVRREPLTYEPASPHSWFYDLHHGQHGTGREQADAAERLGRHRLQMDVERRVNPNTTPGSGGYFTPPAWFDSLYSTVPRPERVLSELIGSFPLPNGTGHSVNVPAITAGTTVGSSNSPAIVGGVGTPNPSPSTDVTDALNTSPVVTVSGHEDTALQLLDQTPPPGFDAIILSDLIAAYDATLEAELAGGTGGDQLLGLLSIPGILNVPYTDAAPSGVKFHTVLGQGFGQVCDTRLAAPTAWLTAGRRWAWLGTQLDAQGRPLVPPTGTPGGRTPESSGADPIGGILGVATYVDSALPTTIGGNQDVTIGVRPRDFLLWEGEPNFRVNREVLSGSMGVRFTYWSYAAFIAGRYPSGIVAIGGTGCAAPPAF